MRDATYSQADLKPVAARHGRVRARSIARVLLAAWMATWLIGVLQLCCIGGAANAAYAAQMTTSGALDDREPPRDRLHEALCKPPFITASPPAHEVLFAIATPAPLIPLPSAVTYSLMSPHVPPAPPRISVPRCSVAVYLLSARLRL
jgi:hypothetical protein